jgi:hypothetical protein
LGNVSEGSWRTEVLVFEARIVATKTGSRDLTAQEIVLSASTVPGIEPFADYSSNLKLFKGNNLKQLPPAVGAFYNVTRHHQVPTLSRS